MFKRNRWTALMLAGVMGTAAMVSPLTSFDAQAAYTYAKVDGTYRMIDVTAINGVVARGIDVSHWKGVIDWQAVAADDIQFVMLGTTYNGGVDPNFRTNAEGAYRAGLNIGAYLYSYATTPQMASDEADFILDLIKDYPISYPVAFDAESSALGALSPQEISEIINTFCKRIEDAGYYPMVYANDYWLANKIDMSTMHYDVWVARYEIKHNFSNPAMWQATQTGSVNGVNGNVDIDFQYKDFSPLIPSSRWRTIGDKTYYYQDYVMQRDTWIDDGEGWYYMGADAQAMKGWQKLNGQQYYLDETSGRMASGWLAQGDKWYYMGSSGAMKTGWTNVDGSQYFLNEDGVMQTGWHTEGDNDYYLTSSGRMAIGWRDVDGNWYYFSGDGRKQTGWLADGNQTYYLNDDGKMLSGWQKLDNSWYYFNASGQRQSGWLSDGGQNYYLNADGKMLTGWQNLDGFWYYFNTSGQRQNGWVTDGGQTYYTDADGKMLTGWQKLDNAWFYFNSSGQRLTGAVTLNGVMYYLDPATGVMAANTTITLDGVNYQVDGNGVCTQIAAEEGSGDGSAASGEPTPPPAQTATPKGPGEM